MLKTKNKSQTNVAYEKFQLKNLLLKIDICQQISIYLVQNLIIRATAGFFAVRLK